MTTWSRRMVLGTGCAALGLTRIARAEKPVDQRLLPLHQRLQQFFEEHAPPGMSVAVARHGKLVYARGFGFADPEAKMPVTPRSRFRLASVSKPITAVAALRLVDEERIELDAPILKYVAIEAPTPETDPRWKEITVRHCLQHLGGWDRSKSWDPMSSRGARFITKELNRPLPVTVEDILRVMRRRPLDTDPGSTYAYSNFGYCLLGRAIERATGQSYAEAVQRLVFTPLELTGFQLAKNLRTTRAENEVVYIDSKGRTAPAATGPEIDAVVPLPYGVELMETMDANGGWIGSAEEVVRFGMAFDDPASSPLLKPKTIAAMVAPPAGALGHEVNGDPKPIYYGLGWQVRPRPGSRTGVNKWHNGLVSGTSTHFVCRHDGIVWAALFNSDANPKGEQFSGLIDPVMHQAVDAVREWPT